MSANQPDFNSLRKIRDNTLLLSIGNEYLGEDVFLAKIGSEIKKDLNFLKSDVINLKKQFPGKFTPEINTDKILESFRNTALDMLSGSDEIKKDCTSGKLGLSLDGDVTNMSEAIEKIWLHVRGGDVKYTASDSVSGFFGRLDIISKVAGLFSILFKILLFLIIIAGAGFGYLYYTMEKEAPVLKENEEIMAYIGEQKYQLEELERKKANAQKKLKVHDSNNLLRTDKIAIIDIETRIQEFNQKINLIEGQIESSKQTIEENNERIKEIKGRPFMDRLLRQ